MRNLPYPSDLPENTVMSHPWLSDDGSSLLVPITTVKRETSVLLSLQFDIGNYGFRGLNQNEFSIYQISAYDG
jgi:hypothetical protein